MNMALIYGVSALVITTALLSYTLGAANEWYRDKDVRRALANSYQDQELLRQQIYLMRVAGAATQGAGSSVAARRSHLTGLE